MGEAYPMETVDRAQELYCLDGLTYEQTAEAVGAAASTLKRWGAEYGWAEKRRAYRQEQLAIKENTVRLRAKLIRDCLSTDAGANPLNLFAVAKLEEAAVKAADFELKARQAAAVEAKAGPRREIRTATDALAAVDEAIELALNRMLTTPEAISLGRLKELKGCFDLAQQLRAQHAPAEEQGARSEDGLSSSTVEAIKRQIWGVQS